ncbi:MAG: putative ATP-dependent DNA helicase PIF1, partial [Streblomastix strix]
MRALTSEFGFTEWLLRIGNGVEPANTLKEVSLPQQIIAQHDLLLEIYGDVDLNNENEQINRVILCSTNQESLSMNEDILSGINGNMKTYKSIDSAIVEEGQSDQSYPIEWLNQQTLPGMPPHILNLKVGSIVMLLRNLNIQQGLCNGTRLIITDLSKKTYIQCRAITGSQKGKQVFIPRIDIVPSDSPFPFDFHRLQYPIRLAFSMTINKAQGQSFTHVGIDLSKPVFAHGQLYVALSRSRSMA